MKTSELTGIPLCWFVAIAQGLVPRYEKMQPWEGGKMGIHVDNMELYEGKWRRTDMGWHEYRPSENWAQGGPIIERECIDLYCDHAGVAWRARRMIGVQINPMSNGSTPLIAAMRCYVASKLGDEVEIPEELK